MKFSDLDALLLQGTTVERAAPRHAVVVIDDDASIRDSLAFLLEDQYQLTACASAREGVAAIHEDVCAVILDVKMSGHDGFWGVQ